MEAITNNDGKPLYPGFTEFMWVDEPIQEWDSHHWQLLGIFPVQVTEEALVGGESVVRDYRHSQVQLNGATAQLNVLNRFKFLYGKKTDVVIDGLKGSIDHLNNQAWDRNKEIGELKKENERLDKDMKEALKSAEDFRKKTMSMRGDMNSLIEGEKKLRRDLNALVEAFGKRAVDEVLKQFEEDDG